MTPTRLVMLVCIAQVCAQIGAYTWPALLPGFIADWRITAGRSTRDLDTGPGTQEEQQPQPCDRGRARDTEHRLQPIGAGGRRPGQVHRPAGLISSSIARRVKMTAGIRRQASRNASAFFTKAS